MNPESLFYLGVGLGGLFLVFFGYRLFQSAITLIGTVAGGLYGYTIVEMAMEGEAALWLSWVGGLVGALIGLGSALGVYYLGIFAAGAFLGFWFATSLIEGFDLPYPLAILVVLTVLVGFVAMALERWTLIVLTAVAGAWHLTAAIGYFTTGVDLLPYQHPFYTGEWLQSLEATSVLVAAGIFLLGFLVQKFITAKRKVAG